MLRVCHVIHSLGDGGAEHVLVNLAEVASSVELDVSIVSLMPDDGLRYGRQLRELGVRVESLALGTRWDVRGLAKATCVIRELGPDVLHTHLKHADVVGAFVARRLDMPMVSTLHLIEDVTDPLRRAKRRVAAQARSRVAQRTIAVSDAQRRWYLEAFGADPQRVVTVRNAVLLPPPSASAERRRFRAHHGIPDHTVLAAMVALLRPGKGHGDLLAAVRLLPADLDLTVLVAGDGPLRPGLEAEVAADVRLRDRVRFAGFVEDVGALIAASDLVVHPSHFDALPTALIYALAGGVPTIATAVGGIPEIIGDGAGVLVPAHDPQALATAVFELVEDPTLRCRLSAAAQGRFHREFDPIAWVGALRRLYEEVIDERAVGRAAG